MLIQLDIKNIALIDNVSIEFDSGLNVLTGETGAGKSIIIDSINAILGDRVSKELIRSGHDKALVEAVFNIDKECFAELFERLGITHEEDNSLIISRELSLSGKNICRINGKMATISALKELGECLIDVHGQHDNQSLLKQENHILLLDLFGGEKLEKLKQTYNSQLSRYREVKNKIKSIFGDKFERERKIDLIKFQLDEIKKAKLKVGEEEELNKQRTLLANSEKIVGALSSTYEALFSGNNIKSSASDNLNEAISQLSFILKLDEKYNTLSKGISEILYQLDDIIFDIRKERDLVEFNPDLLEQIEERIDCIYKLKRKYGSSISEIIQYSKKIETELNEIIRGEEIANKLLLEKQQLDEALYNTSKKLNEERSKAGELLEANICNELDALEMRKARFMVKIDFDNEIINSEDRNFSKNGLDTVEFLISTNAGEPLKQLSKIASGGEMSRIMLAIKTILARVDSIPTLIFDEIDIGVSGKASQKVGEKLSYLSRNHQVICVTHLAQIACMADNHYYIRKESDKNNTRTFVDKLSEDKVKNEIARIIGGANISEITVRHAEEILEQAKKIKS